MSLNHVEENEGSTEEETLGAESELNKETRFNEMFIIAGIITTCDYSCFRDIDSKRPIHNQQG